MIPVKIISSVEIPVITEEVMTKLITAEINKSNPELTITSVKFERKLSPQRVEAIVEAHVGKPTTTTTASSVVEEVEVELPDETPEINLDDDEPEEVTTVAELFEDDD